MEQRYDNDELEIDLVEIIRVLWRWAWLIIVAALACGAIAFAYSKFFITPTYESTTRIFVLNQSDGGLTVNDLNLGSQLSNDYKEMIRSRDVVESVISAYRLDTTYEAFVGSIKVSSPSNTRIIDITLTHTNPLLAKEMADTLREEAAVKIQDIMAVDAVNLVSEANVPLYPSAPNVLKWTIIGLLVGGFLSVAIIIVLYLLDDTIKSSEDIEKYLKLSTLGIIPILDNEEDLRKRRRRKDKVALQDELEDREARAHTSKMATVIDLNDME